MGTRRIGGAVALASVALACGCQFSILGSGPAGNETAAPPATVQDGFSAIDLASHLDMPDLSPLPDKIGDACNGQCASGLTCMTWVPAGYCSRTCSGDADCPSGSSCVGINKGKGPQYCLLDEEGGCTRADVGCIDCGAKVCGPSSFCDAC